MLFFSTAFVSVAQAPASAAAAETIAEDEKAAQVLAEEKAKSEKKARKTAEKQAAKEARQKAEAEARAKAEVEKQLKAEQEQKAKAEQATRKVAEEKAKAEEKGRKAAEKQAAKEAKLKAKAEAKAKQEAEEKALAAQKQKEAEARAAKEAAEKRSLEEAEKVKAETKAKEKARIAAEKQAAKEARLKAEAEAKAKQAAEERAVKEAKLKAEEETRAKQEAEDRARAERKEMEKFFRMTPEQRAAALKAKAEGREKAEKERKAAAEKAAKEAAEKKAKEEAEKKAKAEAEAQAKARKEAAKQAAAAEKAAKAEQEKLEREKNAVAGEKAPLVKESQAGAIDRWRFSVGLIRRTIGGMTMNTASYSKNYAIPDKAGDSSTRFGDPGDPNSTADRNYDNGYVRQDGYTDLDSGTWNWGYDSSGQVQGDTLSFRWKSREYTKFSRATTVTTAELDDGSDRDAEAYLQAEYVVKKIGYVDCGVHLDLARTFFSTGGNNFNTFHDAQEWATYRDYGEDVYSLAGTGITPDSSPYHGDHDGPGPTIDNIPMDRRSGGTAEIDSGSYEAYNSIDQSLRINVSTLSFGLTLAGRYERLSLTGSTGPTLNLVDTDATYQETLFESRNGRPASVLNSWSDQQHASEYKLGYFVQGQLAVQAIRHLELGFFGRYDWAEKVTGSVGQSSYSINPEGGSVGGMAAVAF